MSGPFDDDEEGRDREADALDALGTRFVTALGFKDAGKIDEAEDELRGILGEEPRLAEPRMELARILLDTERLSDAEDHAREALEQLEQSGPWTQDVPPNVLLGLAHALLAEILRRRAEDDDVIFGDPDEFKALIDESKAHFEKAAALDPSDEYASYHAFFLGIPGHKGTVDLGDGVKPDDDDVN